MAIKVWTLSDQFNTAELNANFAEVSTKSSYIPTASNLGAVKAHLAMVKNGIGRYVLKANSGTWVASNFYILCTLDSVYRPLVDIQKDIVIGSAIYAKLYIQADGIVRVYARTNATNTAITIDETYII